MSLSQSRPLTEVRVVDLEGRPVKTAEVSAKRQPQEGGVKFGFNEILNVWSGEKLDSGPWLFSVDAPGFESQIRELAGYTSRRAGALHPRSPRFAVLSSRQRESAFRSCRSRRVDRGVDDAGDGVTAGGPVRSREGTWVGTG